MANYFVKYVLRVLFTILSYKGIDMGERGDKKGVSKRTARWENGCMMEG